MWSQHGLKIDLKNIEINKLVGVTYELIRRIQDKLKHFKTTFRPSITVGLYISFFEFQRISLNLSYISISNTFWE